MSKNKIQDVPITNHLLGALPAKEYQLLLPKLELVELVYTKVLYERNQIIEHLYFPNSGIISLNAVEEDRIVLEIAMVGKEGVYGLPVFLGEQTTVSGRVVVQGAGSAMRIKAADFLECCESDDALARLLKLYTCRFVKQMAQAMVCNNLHQTQERLARWLLMIRDRMENDRFPITQNTLSNMLGVRREAVTKSAGNLQRRGLINYHRGALEIVNLAGLEAAACFCYAAFRERERESPRFDIRPFAASANGSPSRTSFSEI